MIFHLHKNIIFILSVILCSINMLLGQNNKQDKRNLETFEDQLQYEKFSNGFSYYINKNGDNSGKIYLKLLVKAGSLQEDKNQMNIAHAVEHLVSKGSTNFPKGIKQEYEKFAGKGVIYNMFTSGSHYAQYNLIVPRGNQEAFNAAILFYKDILTGVTLSKSNINSERGVLRQEFISQTDQNLQAIMLQSKLRTQLFPCRLDLSNFFEHNKNFSVEAVRNFYRDWYRTDLMTLIVTGDIVEPIRIQNTIKQTFSNVPKTPNPRKLKNCDSIYFTQPNKYVVVERKNDSLNQHKGMQTEIQLFYRDTEMVNISSTLEKAKRKLTWEAVTRTLNDRFDEQSNKYLNTYNLLSRYSYKRHPSAFNLKLDSEPSEEILGLKQMIYILNQMKEFGLQSEEWALMKSEILTELKQLDMQNSFFLLNHIRDHEIYAEGQGEEEIEKQISWLSDLTLVEVNRIIKNLIPTSPNDIGIIASKKSEAFKFSEERFRKEIQKVYNNPLKKYSVPEISNALMNPETKKDLELADYNIIGVGDYGEKVLELKNGVRVVLKDYTPTSGFNKEKIILHGFRNQGASSFPDETYFSAINAPKIVKNSGVGEFDKFQLNRFLKNTSFWQGVQPYIEYEETGIKGSAESQDIEDLLQLVYLFITQPRQDSLGFEDWRKNQKEFYENPPSDRVHADITDAIAGFLNDRAINLNGYRALKGIDDTNMDKAYEIFQKLYGNASDFNFIITGEFSEQKIISLVRKYLGNLPAKDPGLPTQSKLNPNQTPEGPIFQEFYSPLPHTSDRYTTKFIRNQKDDFDWKEEIKVQLLGLITNHKIQNLRYKKKLSVYQKGAMGKFDNKLWRMEVGVSIACLTSDLEAIREACDEIYSEIKTGNFEEAVLEETKSRLAKYYSEAYLVRNAQMNNRLYEVNRYNKILPDSKKALGYIAILTKEDITDVAKIYFQKNNRYEFVLRANNL